MQKKDIGTWCFYSDKLYARACENNLLEYVKNRELVYIASVSIKHIVLYHVSIHAVIKVIKKYLAHHLASRRRGTCDTF